MSTFIFHFFVWAYMVSYLQEYLCHFLDYVTAVSKNFQDKAGTK